MIYPDSSISELYIPLPPPLSHIRVTAPRPSDLEARIIHLNTNEISDLLRDPPWPYPRALAEERLAKDLALAQDLLDQYTAGSKHGWFDGCPFRAIREVKEDGSDECIGDIFSARVTPGDTWLDGDEPLDNLTRPVGDAGIWWTIGSKPCLTLYHYSIRRPAPYSVPGPFAPPQRDHVRCPEGTPKGMDGTEDELSNHLGRQLSLQRGESRDVCEEWLQGRGRERECSRSSRGMEDHTKIEVEIGRAGLARVRARGVRVQNRGFQLVAQKWVGTLLTGDKG